MNQEQFFVELEERKQILDALGRGSLSRGNPEHHAFFCGAVRACNQFEADLRKNDGRLDTYTIMELHETINWFQQRNGHHESFSTALKSTTEGLCHFYRNEVEE